MSNPLTFEIEFKSDFHIGAGHGLGLQVDSALLRDPDGVPVIRGTVIEGLLRESLANLLGMAKLQARQTCAASGAKTEKTYCGQWATNETACPVCAIFGSPRQAKRWQVSSARPVMLVELQRRQSGWRAGETAAQTTTRVRVNPRTRRAEENKLFTREEGDGSLRFCFTAECAEDDAATTAEAAWLIAAARLLRNIGASKYRGRGECEIHLVDRVQEKVLLDSFAARLNDHKPPSVVQPTAVKKSDRLTLPPDPDRHTYRLRVLLRADEPLLLARRAEAGNQFETLDGIPGAILRGALAWRVAHRAGEDMNVVPRSAAYQNFVDLFFRGAVRVSSLMPIQVPKNSVHRGYLTLPAPRDLLTCELHRGYVKDETDKSHGVWSMAWENGEPGDCPLCAQAARGRGLPDPKVKLEALDGLVPLMRDTLQEFKQKRTVEMHIRTEPGTGRVRTGDLFGYVLLEPGQYFVGEITCADAATWTALQQMAGLKPVRDVNELRLGKANRRGYGKVSLVFETATQSPWQGPDLGDRIPDPNAVVLTLVSDAIVTDSWGRFERGFDAGWLQRELKLPHGAAVTIASEEARQLRQFSAVRAVDAFNAKLGLPRARDVALAAGSSVRLVFTGVTQPALVDHLAAIEMAGIGLRRDEGFGRVAFNHPIHQRCATWEEGALELGSLALGSSANDHGLAKLAHFESEWAEVLNEKLAVALKAKPKMFDDGRFEAVARLEHVSNATSQQTAVALLEGLGEQQQLLLEPLTGRDKKNFFDTEGKPGVEQVRALLGDLSALIARQQVDAQLEPRLWRMGLQMLADRIAEPARRKAQEGR
jgi:CRISPR-associated protein Csx10